ncbi:MAG: hypothetical protein EBV03_14065, partial [Proteobacteria bacterium]|nr:hypothetical protein [Pseudomonadota bacterium]
TVAHEVAEAAAHSPLLGLSSMFGASTVGLLTVGLSAGVSAALTQMDYVHRKDNIKEMYKEEIATRLKKPLNKVTRDDLETLAAENKTIAQEMSQIKKQRSFGVGISFLASMAAIAAVTFALPAIVSAVTGIATTTAAMASLGVVGGFVAKAATALVTYNLVKEPLHHAADQLFNLDYATTHDKIMGLKRQREAGLNVTPEQAFNGLIETEKKLRNPQTRAQAFMQLAHEYNIDIGDLTKVPFDPYKYQLEQELQRQKTQLEQLGQSRQMAEQAQLSRTIEQFAQNHEHFEELRETMADLLDKGLASDLEEAYVKAARLNDDVFGRMQAKAPAPTQSTGHLHRANEAAKA